jgi:chromodomain-helicase-DNA-binding protein 1
MGEELLEQYKAVERIIGHQDATSENGEVHTEYLVKWCCLSYADSTWETEELVLHQYAHKIDEYMRRVEATTIPSRGQSFKRRPRFEKLENMPDFLRQPNNPDLELRDYQLEGLNWLLHAWSK